MKKVFLIFFLLMSPLAFSQTGKTGVFGKVVTIKKSPKKKSFSRDLPPVVVSIPIEALNTVEFNLYDFVSDTDQRPVASRIIPKNGKFYLPATAKFVGRPVAYVVTEHGINFFGNTETAATQQPPKVNEPATNDKMKFVYDLEAWAFERESGLAAEREHQVRAAAWAGFSHVSIPLISGELIQDSRLKNEGNFRQSLDFITKTLNMRLFLSIESFLSFGEEYDRSVWDDGSVSEFPSWHSERNKAIITKNYKYLLGWLNDNYGQYIDGVVIRNGNTGEFYLQTVDLGKIDDNAARGKYGDYSTLARAAWNNYLGTDNEVIPQPMWSSGKWAFGDLLKYSGSKGYKYGDFVGITMLNWFRHCRNTVRGINPNWKVSFFAGDILSTQCTNWYFNGTAFVDLLNESDTFYHSDGSDNACPDGNCEALPYEYWKKSVGVAITPDGHESAMQFDPPDMGFGIGHWTGVCSLAGKRNHVDIVLTQALSFKRLGGSQIWTAMYQPSGYGSESCNLLEYWKVIIERIKIEPVANITHKSINLQLGLDVYGGNPIERIKEKFEQGFTRIRLLK